MVRLRSCSTTTIAGAALAVAFTCSEHAHACRASIAMHYLHQSLAHLCSVNVHCMSNLVPCKRLSISIWAYQHVQL